MYFAPSIAFSVPHSKPLANFSIVPFIGKLIIFLANGSSPILIASLALVFFFSLNGRYKSSTSLNFSQAKIEALNSSVIKSFSSINLITSSFLFSKFSKYVYSFSILLICSSSNEPVASFL